MANSVHSKVLEEGVTAQERSPQKEGRVDRKRSQAEGVFPLSRLLPVGKTPTLHGSHLHMGGLLPGVPTFDFSQQVEMIQG